MVRGGTHGNGASHVRSLRTHALLVSDRATWRRWNRDLLRDGSCGTTSSGRKLWDVTLLPCTSRLSRALFADAVESRGALARCSSKTVAQTVARDPHNPHRAGED